MTSTTKHKILLCEDDPNLGRVMKLFLEENGFTVHLEKEGRLGLMAFRKDNFDMCLLDIMMPHMDGFTLATEIRKINADVPLFFITAKNMKADIMKAYKLGGDDYITKPFDSQILLAKIKAIINRNESKMKLEEGGEEGKITLGKYTYDTKLRDLYFDGQIKNRLSPTEHNLLILLYKYKNDVLEREMALRKIWGTDTYFNSRSMDVYITRLRKYFVNDSRVEINNLYSTGFRLKLPT